MQQVSMQPSTDSALCPTGRPSSRLWLAWLTRTHLARRPWPRGKRPVWISSNSCWLGPTQIWVRDTHPNVSTYLSVCVTTCALAQSTCLPIALVSLYIFSAFVCFFFCRLLFLLWALSLFYFFFASHSWFTHSVCQLCRAFNDAVIGESHPAIWTCRLQGGKNTTDNKSKWQAFVLTKRQAFIVYPTPETVWYHCHPSGHEILADPSLYSWLCVLWN